MPEEKGLRLAIEADLTGKGFKDTVSKMQMTLRNAQGEESVRKFYSKALEMDNDGDKSIFIFQHPKDVDGTAVLTFTHKSGPDDQWLYLPALKRVKRISSDNKSGSFVGSEFAYEDLSSQEVEKYTCNKDLEKEVYDLYTTKLDRTNYIIVILAIFFIIALAIFASMTN